MSRAAGFIALAALCAGTAVAQAQVYRCGPDGRSYSQEPCAQGQTIDVADPRSAQQAAQARQATLRDARQADELERARLRAERLAASQGPALIGWSKPKAATDKVCSKGTACKGGEPSKPRSNSQAVTLYRERGAASR
jgi:hypothetical protein